MKPSVPKVVITTDKPKAPVLISKSKEGIATKQERVSISHEKVIGTVLAMFVLLSSILTKPFVSLSKY